MVEEDEGPPAPSRFCCRYFKIINGAYMVAITYCVFIVCNLGLHIYKVYKSAEVKWNWQMLFTACDTVSVACLFFGLIRRRPAFLQPFTVVSVSILFTVSQLLTRVDVISGRLECCQYFLSDHCLKDHYLQITTVNFCILLTMSYAMAALYPTSYYGEQLEIALANNIQYIADAFGVKNRQVLVCAAVAATVVYAGTVFIHSWFMVIVVHCAQWQRSLADKNNLTETIMLEENKEPPCEHASSTTDDSLENGERAVSYL